MKIEQKIYARELRKKGKSLNEIISATGYSKGSVSVWVRDIELTKNQRKRISEKGRTFESIERRRMKRLYNESVKRKKVIDIAKKDFAKISKEELKMIGIVLYMGEGTKTKIGTASLTNSDEKIIKITMRFFREICMVEEKKFRAYIHTFEKANVTLIEKYWSNITKIPRSQFYKTYIKQSISTQNKRKTLPMGTIEISVNDTKLYLTIMGWIEKIKELLVGNIENN